MLSALWYADSSFGGVAQLVERYVRNVEVDGSSPFTSTRAEVVSGNFAPRVAGRLVACPVAYPIVRTLWDTYSNP